MDELLELFNDPTQWGFTDNKMKKSLQSMISAYGPGGMFEGKFDSPEYKRDISMFSIYNNPKYKQDDQSIEGWQDLPVNRMGGSKYEIPSDYQFNTEILDTYLRQQFDPNYTFTATPYSHSVASSYGHGNPGSIGAGSSQVTNQPDSSVNVNVLNPNQQNEITPFLNTNPTVNENVTNTPKQNWRQQPFSPYEKNVYDEFGNVTGTQTVQNYPRGYTGEIPEGSVQTSRFGDWSQKVMGKYGNIQDMYQGVQDKVADRIGIFKPGQGFTEAAGGLQNVRQYSNIVSSLIKNTLQDDDPYRMSAQDVAGHGISMFSNLATGNLIGFGTDVVDFMKSTAGGAKLRKEENEKRKQQQRDIDLQEDLADQQERMALYGKKGMRIKYAKGGMTEGEFNHKTNPLTIVDKKGNNTGMELTGGEGVFDQQAMKMIDKYRAGGQWKELGKFVNKEIKTWNK